MVQNTRESSRRNRTRLLLVAPDVVGRRMAGPGMRYVAIAKALAPDLQVTFAVGVDGSESLDFGSLGVGVVNYTSREELERLVDDTDIVFCQFIDVNVVLHALRCGKRVVYDFYNVLPVETVGAERISGFTDAVGKSREFGELLRYFRFCCATGSYFVTSNDRQRDFWLGYIMASGALTPSTLGDRAVDDIIGLTPFGMEETDPVQTRHALRGRHGISESDFVAVWAGGIWDWFDAETPIRAVAGLATTRPDIKLVFYGTVHPNKTIGKPAAVERAQELAAELGVLGTNVIFLDEWVPVDDRVNYLLDADIAISAHKKSLETHYAFRTRILDHFWARLPSIVSEGDWFAEYIADNDMGIVTPCLDIEAMTQAILELYADPERRNRVSGKVTEQREAWRWSATTRTLREVLTTGLDSLPFIAEPEDPTTSATTRSATGPAPVIGRPLVSALRKTPLWPVLQSVRRHMRR